MCEDLPVLLQIKQVWEKMENQSFALTFYDAEMRLMQQQVAMTLLLIISYVTQ